MQVEMGLWEFLTKKANATLMQERIAPWLIANYGLSYARSIRLEVVKGILFAVCDSLNLLEDSMTSEEAAKAYPNSLADMYMSVHCSTK
jgi:hypothetical protein